MTSDAASAPAAARSLIAVRVLLLALAAGALVWAVVAARERSSEAHVRYVCPMHAEVTSAAAGRCPICGMNLEPVVTGAPAAIKPSSYLTYDTERRRAYGPDAPAPAWVADDGTLWAVIYRDQLAARRADERATFSSARTGAQGIAVTPLADEPEPWDGSTAHVHFQPDAAAGALHPGDVGWLHRARSPEPPILPVAAVLEAATGPYVLVASPDGHTLHAQPVAIGRVFGGVVAIVSGLQASERVLTGGGFFVDAERRLRGQPTLELAPR